MLSLYYNKKQDEQYDWNNSIFLKRSEKCLKEFNQFVTFVNKSCNNFFVSIEFVRLEAVKLLQRRSEHKLPILYETLCCSFGKGNGSSGSNYSYKKLVELIRWMSYRVDNYKILTTSRHYISAIPGDIHFQEINKLFCLVHPSSYSVTNGLCSSCYKKLIRLGLANMKIDKGILKVLSTRKTLSKEFCVNHAKVRQYADSLCIDCFRKVEVVVAELD